MRFLFYLLFFLLFFSFPSKAQEIGTVEGITVIVPPKEKPKSGCFSIAGGYQIPSLVNVPMLPEHAPNLVKNSDMEVIIPGWFGQVGINKKTKSNFEFGLQAGYYGTSVPVALKGQRSTSDWVLAQSGNPFTKIYLEDVTRTSITVTIRAIVKYKYPIKNSNLWLGLAGGSFSSVIDYNYSSGSKPNDTYRQTGPGISYLAGFDLVKKNKNGEDKIGFTLFGDFSGPSINEFFISLFEPGWRYDNIPDNHSINPIRIGLSLNIY
ncbi:MAG: hypothetical protein K9H49_08800 [Bacteroidales bacterium]|nr:hypothetical protein [Bacteroidales bacterium]MCF8389528.1 hypothetical protein [Bacteroidales bacterium]